MHKSNALQLVPFGATSSSRAPAAEVFK